MSDPVEWKRPHPLSIAVSGINFVANNAFTVGFLLLAGGAGAGFELMGIGLGAVSVAAGAAQWWVTRYAVTDHAVEHRTGVFNRQARAIPLDRIQQVAVGEPVVARVFGLASVQVSEASADGDVTISYLTNAEAAALTERLRALARARDALATEAPGDQSLAPPPPPPSYTVHQGELGDLVRYQLAVSAPGLLVGLVVVALAAVAVGLGVGLLGGSVAFVAGLLALGAIAVSGLVSLILSFGAFELRRGDRGLMVDTGLLSKRHLEVRPDRIQTVTVSSGPVARRVGLHQVVFSAAVGKAAAETRVIHLGPAVRTGEVGELMRRSVDLDPAFDEELEAVSILTIRRFLVRSAVAFLLVGLPAAIIGAITAHPVVAGLVVAAWAGFSIPYARARHRRLGVAVADDRMVMRRGVLTHQLTQLAPANVQSVSVRATFFQRRLGLAHLLVSTAGVGPSHAVEVPDLEVERAEAMATQLARVAAATRWELGGG